MPLTDLAIRQSKPAPKPQRLSDSGGLYLEVSPAGGKLWRWKFRFAGKEKRLALGTWPRVSLKEARMARDDARRQLDDGVDPGQAKKREKSLRGVSTEAGFEAVAREWHKSRLPAWSDIHGATVLRRLELNVFPWLGSFDVAEIRAPEVLGVLRKIEERGANETASRVREIVGQVFRYAIATGRASYNPSADLKGALEASVERHHAAITKPGEFGRLVRDMRAYKGSAVVRAALMFSALVWQRPSEIRAATWGEIDLDGAMWTIPAARMKRGVKMKQNGDDHAVPLSRQAVAVLRDLELLTGQRGPAAFVFPGERGPARPLSENGVRTALRSLGYSNEQMTPNGFRASARTMLDEALGVRVDLIEHQLAHSVRDALGRAYNRTSFLPERTEMMQQWSDYIDQLALY